MPNDDDRRLIEYWSKLVRLAERNLSTRLKRKVGAEDIAQTVFRTVLRRIENGKFCLDDYQTDDELWKILKVITLRRISNKARAFKTEKKDWDREIAFGDAPVDLRSREPSTEDVLAFLEILDRFQQKLEAQFADDARKDDLRRIFEMRLAGFTYEELAGQLNCSVKTVQRRMEMIHNLLHEIDQR